MWGEGWRRVEWKGSGRQGRELFTNKKSNTRARMKNRINVPIHPTKVPAGAKGGYGNEQTIQNKRTNDQINNLRTNKISSINEAKNPSIPKSK